MAKVFPRCLTYDEALNTYIYFEGFPGGFIPGAGRWLIGESDKEYLANCDIPLLWFTAKRGRAAMLLPEPCKQAIMGIMGVAGAHVEQEAGGNIFIAFCTYPHVVRMAVLRKGDTFELWRGGKIISQAGCSDGRALSRYDNKGTLLKSFEIPGFGSSYTQPAYVEIMYYQGIVQISVNKEQTVELDIDFVNTGSIDEVYLDWSATETSYNTLILLARPTNAPGALSLLSIPYIVTILPSDMVEGRFREWTPRTGIPDLDAIDGERGYVTTAEHAMHSFVTHKWSEVLFPAYIAEVSVVRRDDTRVRKCYRLFVYQQPDYLIHSEFYPISNTLLAHTHVWITRDFAKTLEKLRETEFGVRLCTKRYIPYYYAPYYVPYYVPYSGG